MSCTPHLDEARVALCSSTRALSVSMLVWLVSSVSAAQSPGATGDPFLAELRWAAQLEASEGALVPASSSEAPAVATEGEAEPEHYVRQTIRAWSAADVALTPQERALGRARHRVGTAQATGYAVGTFAAVLSAVSALVRHGCQGEDVSRSDFNGARWVTVPVMALGLSVGLAGTIRSVRLRRAHGDGPRIRSPQGPLLAALGSLAAVGGVAFASAVTMMCNG